MEIPENVAFILKKLEENGYEGYAVGGCVRDTLLGREPGDWDITTSAKPEQVKKLFRRTIDTGIQHGTVTVMLGEEGYEVTTYRMDGEYEDHRHPKKVIFTPNLIEDLKRRDFTINAMAYNPTSGIVDAFDGIGDLERKRICCVGEATERFEEDALRMLRGIRFAGQLRFDIEENTLAAIKEKAPTIVNVSAERIRTELTKLLVSGGSNRLLLAVETGLCSYFLPEFETMLQQEQKNPHHRLDVGHHVLEAVHNIYCLCQERPELTEKERVILAYSALLHDVAKPLCYACDEEGIAHFHGHGEKGAEMAKAILCRLKFDNETIHMVEKLIRYHESRHENCYPKNGNFSKEEKERGYCTEGKKAMRRLMSRMGKESMPLLFLLQEADVRAQSDYQQDLKLQGLAAAKRCYKDICEAAEAVTIKELAVSGKELIALGVKPGPAMGELLQELLNIVLEEPEKNTRDDLLEMVKSKLS